MEARGTLLRKQNFYMSLALQRARQNRYRIDEEILTNASAGVAAAREGGDDREIAWTVFSLGFFLLWHGDLEKAREKLEESLRVVERTGDPVLPACCLCYLNVTALRRHDVQGVRNLSGEALAAADAAGYPEYIAAARAAQAWVAWKDERFDEVICLADAALELWERTVVSYSWYWICLWPLISVRLHMGQVPQAVAACRKLLVPPQQRLPDELESLIQSAESAWANRDAALSAGDLAKAVELASRLGYC